MPSPMNTYIFGQPRYQVVAPAAVIRTIGSGLGGAGRMLYQGSIVPANVGAREARRLLDKGIIAKIEEDAQ